MAKEKTIFACQSCGIESPKWLGRCPECGGWNTFVEERSSSQKPTRHAMEVALARPITQISAKTGLTRAHTGISELDRVLGGGIVPGSAVLIGGDPGIGKSTLLLQAMGNIAKAGRKVLYVSGEESAHQIKLRAKRLKALYDDLLVYPETSVERIIETLREIRPDVVVVDSAQTIYTETIGSSPGSVSQLREASAMIIGSAKSLDIPVFLVGHVTKDGTIAGPKVLEHMVDTVLYFEGERGHVFRVLRAVKNRFGSNMEIGVFEMRDDGLLEVTNPSEVFLSGRPASSTGSCVVASVEGTRTVLVEVQSLVCPTLFGVPRRTISGVDYNRAILTAAVLEKKASIPLANHDIFIKVAGGLKVDEPSVDLGVLCSLASSYLEKPIDATTVVFGEVGLAGEIRGVTQAEQRIKEAARLGFNRCALPAQSKGAKGFGLELVYVSTAKEAIDKLF